MSSWFVRSLLRGRTIEQSFSISTALLVLVLIGTTMVVVEDRVKSGKNLGLRNLPSKSWTVNRGWVLAANLANDLDTWTRLLGLYDQHDLARATPETLRYRLWHIPARLVRHARRRRLKISTD